MNMQNLTRQSSGLSQNYKIVRNLKTLLRRTTGLVYPSQYTVSTFDEESSKSETSSVGPATLQPSMSDVLNYANVYKVSSLSDNVSSNCTKIQVDGIQLEKVTRNKRKTYRFTLDNDNSAILWKLGAKRIELDSIRDVRIGNMASNYREEYGVPDKYSDMWLTIIYSVSNKLKALHVIAANKDDFDMFLSCICGLVSRRRQIMKSISVPDTDKFARIHWDTTVSERAEDRFRDSLTFDEVTKLCKRFHIYCSKDHLWKIFNIADINNNLLLNFSEFQHFVELLRERREVNQIWTTICHKQESIDLSVFYMFLTDIQQEKMITYNEASALYDKYKSATTGLLDEEGFLKYLSNISFMTDETENEFDYSRPLNHYFIASSHNTYLLGKQIAETPSVEAYIQVLQQGCRSVEIDIWDDEAGPVVCHGALTAAIPLVNIIKVIRKYAFLSSPFPLIISLEIHCSKENQQITRDIIEDAFGEMLYRDHTEDGDMPSPMQLKHRIILKSKKSKNITADGSTDSSENNGKNGSSSTLDYSSSFSMSQYDDSEGYSSTSGTKNTSRRSSFSGRKIDTIQGMTPAEPTNFNRIKRLGTMTGRASVIKDIIEISAIYGVKYRNFSLPESKTASHCFSLNEKKVASMCKDVALKLSIDKHNRRYLMRIYPHVFRYKSSNFNPIDYWKLGVQMVATNWQTNDLGQQLNLAMFQLTNQKNEISHSGYVPKPQSLIESVAKAKDIATMYKTLRDEAITKPVVVRLKILSGQLLPKVEQKSGKDSEFAPYVCVKFINPSDSVMLPVRNIQNCSKISDEEVRTAPCPGNGFNPIWNADISLGLLNTDFSFIQFAVKTGDITLAECTIKLDYLKHGYRHIPLYNVEGERYIFSTLFIYSHTSHGST
ncbi:phosphatidylinositol phospholipase C [Maudiozyma humilis]|uniref:Phosphoinositide phospholipase C n=1 Tax=Maudiozyma humilis TaxID=51915 RepID=A0AAV5RTH5_MAUHU|nr:phosphatidylinositol phospholipase C [Kazachstania humilis]